MIPGNPIRENGSKSILFPWNIIRITIPMQTRLHVETNFDGIFVASKSRLRRNCIFILKRPRHFFGNCAGGRCHLRVVRRRLLSHCDNDPRFAKEVEEKRERQGIVNKQLRSLRPTLNSFTHSTRPPHTQRFLYPLTNIRISPLINRGYRMNAYRAQFLIRALLIRSEIWELCCCLISDPPVMLLATDTKVTDTVIALL